MAKTIETPIQIRFSDVDPLRHVNNVSQQMYFDLGKGDYFKRVMDEYKPVDDIFSITASTATSYMVQVRITDTLHVTTTCERVGNKSFTLLQRLFAGERLCTESRSTMVAFDFKRQESIPVPDAWRARMTQD